MICVPGHGHAVRGSARRRARLAAGRRAAAARRSYPRTTSGSVRLVFGSCRVGGPQPDSLEAPWHERLRALGVDALWTYSRALQRGEVEWPDALLLLGDQVYADEVSPETLAFIKARRDTSDAARASRSPTSRSTRGSTASRGQSRTFAGCSRPSRAR